MSRGRVGPHYMSRRARFYLATVSVQHVVLALLCWFGGGWLVEGGYLVGVVWLGWDWGLVLCGWGVVFGVAALFAGLGAVFQREGFAHVGLFVSVVSAGCWVAGLAGGAWFGVGPGWYPVVVLGALAVRDLVLLRNPLQDPFDVIRRARVAHRGG